MSPVIFPIALGVAVVIFSYTVWRRARLLLAARPVARFDRPAERVGRTIIYALGQKKFLRDERPAGLMHALVFWGFTVLLLQVITLFGRAFDASWYLPGLGPTQPLGPPFFALRDLFELVVIVAVGYLLYRRVVVHTPRLFGIGSAEDRYRSKSHWEGLVILVLILFIMVGSLLYDASRLVAGGVQVNERHYAPLTTLLAHALGGLSRPSAHTLSEVGWWLHNATVLVFLDALPLSKHFHILTAIPNLFFAKLPEREAARGRVRAAPTAALDRPGEGFVGVVSPSDLSWKQVLDGFSCTECGRCTAVCPATASGAPLAPRQLILDIRDRLYGRRRDEVLAAEDVLWACTTCMACVEACPVGIEHVPTIVDMRRVLVDEGRIEPSLQRALSNVAMQGNAYGKPGRSRGSWTVGLEFDVPDARTERVDYVWFVGDVASFDERAQLASQRLARLLHAAGVSFGLLYDGERNAGNDVRRVGEEGLFEMLVQHNVGVLAESQAEAIFTTDPHSLNTLRNEYPRFGLEKPVYHYTELLAHLTEQGAISPRTPLGGTRVTYHDPCYLARYNRITDAPRRVIAATGAELVEMVRHGINTFCCGAGGGRIWMNDTSSGERPSEQRIREAQTLGSIDYFVVSCPKDLAMYSDAAKVMSASFEVMELTALVERALASSGSARD